MKDKLIKALEKERENFDEKGFDTTDHDYAIHYLKTGEIKDDNEIFELLQACVEDIDMMYADYVA